MINSVIVDNESVLFVVKEERVSFSLTNGQG